ncbi:MAG: hypothetical protein BWK76_17825 [Desulfobulbaceae bacterium A2]|nr:MAG: hypothetical protein BWK76_17825 [Desulfobulbaceae bacterium A2]
MCHIRSVLHLLIFCACCLIGASVAVAGSNPWEKPLPFKEGIITIELSGSEQGQEVISIREAGKQRAIRRQSTMATMAGQHVTDSLELVDPEWIYEYDLAAKTGSKSRNPARIFQEELAKLSDKERKLVQANAEKFGANVTSSMGGQVQEKAMKIHGFDCDLVSVMGSKVYMIHGTDIALQSEVSVMGFEQTGKASGVKLSAPPASAFAHPQGIKAELDAEEEKATREMVAGMVQWLKDPKSNTAPFPKPGLSPAAPGEQQPMDPAMQQAMEQLMKGMSGQQQ